jgi:hypothetical protein
MIFTGLIKLLSIKINLDNIMMWLWNAQHNQRYKLWVIALGSIIDDYNIGLPMLCYVM